MARDIPDDEADIIGTRPTRGTALANLGPLFAGVKGVEVPREIPVVDANGAPLGRVVSITLGPNGTASVAIELSDLEAFDAGACEVVRGPAAASAALTVRCTGVSARWCPRCGECNCRPSLFLNDARCPLHAPASPHAADATA